MSHYNHKGRPGRIGGSLPRRSNLFNLFQTLKGGAGSGNKGHAGRLGHRGGSAPGGGGIPSELEKELIKILGPGMKKPPGLTNEDNDKEYLAQNAIAKHLGFEQGNYDYVDAWTNNESMSDIIKAAQEIKQAKDDRKSKKVKDESVEGMSEKLTGKYAKVLENLSDKESRALDNYTDDPEVFNRGGRGNSPESKILDNIIKKAPAIPVDTTVYRGSFIDKDKIKIGETFRDTGFASTTIDKKVALRFASEEGGGESGMMMKIKVPKGSKGLYLGNSDYDSGEAGGEKELLLPRNTGFKITSTSEVNDGSYSYTLVEAELVD